MRLKLSPGLDTTINIDGGAGQINGLVSSFIEVTRPQTPAQVTFEISLIDYKGKESNRLSGSISIIIDDSGRYWYSTDLSVNCMLNEVAWYNNQYIAVGNCGIIATSPDGRSWTKHSTPTGRNLYGITWTGSQYVAVGEYGTILTSTDGDSWQDHSLSDNVYNPLWSVAWSGSLLVAVGEYSLPVGRTDILTSPDGINWTRNDFSINRSELRSVTWAGNQFVAVGLGRTADFGYPLLLTSPDGVHWTDRSLMDSRTSLLDVIWTGEKIVAIGGGLTITSTNGLNWLIHESLPGIPLAAITYSGKNFVGVGDGIYTSTDAVNWYNTVPGDHLNFLKTVAWSGLNYVATGAVVNKVMISP
jgi:photosystem II stability/assembly factor-like uncharacterized protein